MKSLVFLPNSNGWILVSILPYYNSDGNMGDQVHENNPDEENDTMKLWQNLDSTMSSGETRNQWEESGRVKMETVEDKVAAGNDRRKSWTNL